MKAVSASSVFKTILLLASGAVALASMPVLAFTPAFVPPAAQVPPGNVLLALSVEFPTGLQVSYTGAYDTTVTKYYDGYFDNKKCYTYDATNQLFVPNSMRTVSGSGHAGCASGSEWSGNVLNWLTMSNLDQFRSVMTGGTRDNFSDMNSTNPGDDANRTVLIRAFSDRNSYNPVKTLPAASAGVPASWVGHFVRSGGYGSKFFTNSTNSFSNLATVADMKAKCTSGTNGSTCFNIRVQVCKYDTSLTNNGLESNCVGPYGAGGYYKPEGLLQEYSGLMRFGAMGYLNDSTKARNGGVLRAQMKSVGSTLVGQGGGANTRREWDADGLMVANPDTADATASSVSNSGVVNYLNKFGYSSGYKGYDPAGELYYAAQLYLRNQSFPSDYTSSMTTAMKDDFPVITTYTDPIINTCQKNFILGIGDIYTHCDANVPGTTVLDTSNCGSSIPTDSAVNVANLWTTITGYEGNSTRAGGATNGNGYMAGLAWWANTQDIRPDLDGTQNISTYWVDVLENNNGGSGINAHSQYWWATKYGGFKTGKVSGGLNPNLLQSSWDTNGDGVPNTLYAGNTPSLLRSSLRAAFNDILASSQDVSSSAAAVTSPRLTSNSQIIYAGYDPKDWTGTVSSCSPTQTSAQCQSSPLWEASRWFDTTYTAGASPKLNNTNRKIFTSHTSGSTFTSMPFLWSSLNTAQTTILNDTDSYGSARLDYLRGSRADEGTLFRVRGNALLGDVVNSNVTYLGGAGPALRGTNFPGHSTYRSGNATRPASVFVGTNDGMLHAFDATNGKEQWAYIPGAVFANLPSLTTLNAWTHKFFVDGTAMVGDTETGNSTTPWRTMLVGGLGGGGRGYFALDVSKQKDGYGTFTEAQLATMPMWEFTSAQDSDLGYTFNEPSIDQITNAYKQIAKVADATTATGVWRVIVGNGYGGNDNSTASNHNAVLFMLNANNGTVATKLIAATSTADLGLSSPAPVDTDFDGLIDTVYAGDLLGKMHKFQFSKLAANSVDYVLAKSGDSAGAWRYLGVLYDAGAAITAAPVVSKACIGTNGWEVMFGTGRILETSDFTSTTPSAFYAVVDNNPSSTLTVASTSLANITYTQSTVSQGTIRQWNAPSLVNKKGWKMDFTGGERIISNPTTPPDTGAVLFNTSKPSGDACTPGSTGFITAVNICTGGIGNISLVDSLGNTLLVGAVSVNTYGVLKSSGTSINSAGNEKIICNQPWCQDRGASGGASGGGSCSGSGCDNDGTVNGGKAPRGRYSWRELFSR